MDSIHSSFLALVFCTATVVFFFFFFLTKRRSRSRLTKLPPGPWQLPIIGNMHQLFSRRQPQHRTLRELSREYAPDGLLHLRLGQVDHVVVSSLEAAKEVLHTHDLVFASRPRLVATEIIFYGATDVAFNVYGSYWRQLRKICVLELLSARRVKAFAAIREAETSSTISSISASAGPAASNITELFRALSCTIVSRAAFGSKCAHADRFIEVVDQATAFLNGLSVSDLFPSLKFVDALSGASSSLKKIHREIDEMLDVIIEEHRDRAAKRDELDADQQDLVDVLLGIQQQDKGKLEFPLTMANIKAVILDLFVGGTETTASVIVWAMAELMRHPEVMRKAQSEVRGALKGKTKNIEGGDVEELEYMKLVIKETLRLHPPGPLLLPRVCGESCKVMGYDIAEGTRVLVNVWAIGRDCRYWDDAESFKPERFEVGRSVDFRGGSFEFLPFGGGRRVCPGINYALANLEIFLASLLYHFDWELPDGMSPPDLDMTEMVGAAATKKLDLCLIAKPYICV